MLHGKDKKKIQAPQDRESLNNPCAGGNLMLHLQKESDAAMTLGLLA